MGAAALPLTDDVVALRDQVGRAPEIEIGKRGAEIGHERPDVVTATPRGMQRIFEQHVRCGNLVDHGEIDLLAPEVGKPAADNGLVVAFLAHRNVPSDLDDQRFRPVISNKEIRAPRACQTPFLVRKSKCDSYVISICEVSCESRF
jgi:hypothetical protein